MSFREIIIQQMFNGLLLGSFYGLVALGYSMVYGIIKLLNFAHADIYMVGGFCSLSLLAFFGGTFFWQRLAWNNCSNVDYYDNCWFIGRSDRKDCL